MTLGPIEILVLAFPENRFSGRILPELERLVEDRTVTIVDGLFVTLDEYGAASYAEFDELDADSEVASLTTVLDSVDGLLSDQDVDELVKELEPGSSAAILVFEHTWVRPLQEAVIDAGGVLVESIRIPGAAVAEVQQAVAALG